MLFRSYINVPIQQFLNAMFFTKSACYISVPIQQFLNAISMFLTKSTCYINAPVETQLINTPLLCKYKSKFVIVNLSLQAVKILFPTFFSIPDHLDRFRLLVKSSCSMRFGYFIVTLDPSWLTSLPGEVYSLSGRCPFLIVHC